MKKSQTSGRDAGTYARRADPGRDSGLSSGSEPRVWLWTYVCEGCKLAALDLETIFGDDEPLGLPAEALGCRCGSRYLPVGEPVRYR